MLLNKRQKHEKVGIQQLVNNLLELGAKGYSSIDFDIGKTICIKHFVDALNNPEQREEIPYACHNSLEKATKLILAYKNSVRDEAR